MAVEMSEILNDDSMSLNDGVSRAALSKNAHWNAVPYSPKALWQITAPERRTGPRSIRGSQL